MIFANKLKHTLINGDCRRMDLIEDESIHLIITSPPYWQLKDYGIEGQIGYNDTYEEYINNLNLVWMECYRTLKCGCRLCINIGDQFARAAYYGRYKVIPIHSEIIKFCETIGFDYMGSIIWQKQTTMHTSGGGKTMGSYPYPRGGIIKIDYENILVFKKLGKCETTNATIRKESQLTDEEWNTYFNSHWYFQGDKQNKHIAVFPEELPKRLIKMFSFKWDTVLDPFMGSGTTAIAALKNERNVIGIELNSNYINYYKEKVISSFPIELTHFEHKISKPITDINSLKNKLPYLFKDYVQLNRNECAINNTYGSVVSDNKIHTDFKISLQQRPINNLEQEKRTVLINHADESTYRKMIELGICYLRIGNTNGSINFSQAFANLSYVVLHTKGENPQMFKLKNMGSFQIWSKNELKELGFKPNSAQLYAILKFYTKNNIELQNYPNLLTRMATYVAKIVPLSEFTYTEK